MFVKTIGDVKVSLGSFERVDSKPTIVRPRLMQMVDGHVGGSQHQWVMAAGLWEEQQ